MPKFKTTEKFLEQSIKKHGDKYEYSKVSYISNLTEVCIICKKHGEFLQKPNCHLQGAGCPKCAIERRTKTQDQIIDDFKGAHKEEYDYSKVQYVDDSTKVCIICPLHGEFLQEPNVHKRGCGCPKCYENKRTKSQDVFIKEIKNIHGNIYDYSKVKYLSNIKEVEIICSKHGSFWQSPACHLRGHRCPKCSKIVIKDGEVCDSQAEAYLYLIYKKMGLKFYHNKKYGNEIGNMRYDFYFPDTNQYEEVTSFDFRKGYMSHLEKKIRREYLTKIKIKKNFVKSKKGIFKFVKMQLTRKQQMYVFANTTTLIMGQ